MEWVYNNDLEEPTLFEGTSHASAQSITAPFDLFAPGPAVESDPHSEGEPEYFGEADSPDHRVPPEQAFALFARHVDFSPAVHIDPPPQAGPRTARLPASETRSARLARLSAEVAALAAEVGMDSQLNTSPALHDLSQLREQLREIEASVAAGALPPCRMSLISVRSSPEDATNALMKPTSASLPSRQSANILPTLERRVAALENSIGVSHLSPACDGKAFGPLLEDVRTRLELVSDVSLPEKLKVDAREIAAILQRQMQSERGAGALRTAMVLEKMERWEHLAETVPLVVERLRSFKHLQNEAACFVDALKSVGKQVDLLIQRSSANAMLISGVQNSLEKNVRAVQDNLAILQDKLKDDTAETSQ